MRSTSTALSLALSLPLSLSLSLALPLLALAQDDALARGRAARERGEHAEALAAFAEAWTAGAAPIARAEMALEELALGRYVLAETHATEALAFAADPALAPVAEALAAARDAAGAHLGSLEIACPAGCTISVDGTALGVAPLPHLVRVEAGTHALHGELAGHEPADASVDVAAGALARATLEPRWIDDRPILERTGEAGEGQRIAGWTAVALGGAALVIGAVALGVELDRDAFLRSEACAPGAPTESREGRCPDAASTRATYTDVARALLLSGAVLGIGGLVLLLTAPSSDPQGASARCAPSFAPGLVCQVAF